LQVFAFRIIPSSAVVLNRSFVVSSCARSAERSVPEPHARAEIDAIEVIDQPFVTDRSRARHERRAVERAESRDDEVAGVFHRPIEQGRTCGSRSEMADFCSLISAMRTALRRLSR
jgi:hypothetical protein